MLFRSLIRVLSESYRSLSCYFGVLSESYRTLSCYFGVLSESYRILIGLCRVISESYHSLIGVLTESYRSLLAVRNINSDNFKFHSTAQSFFGLQLESDFIGMHRTPIRLSQTPSNPHWTPLDSIAF